MTVHFSWLHEYTPLLLAGVLFVAILVYYRRQGSP